MNRSEKHIAENKKHNREVVLRDVVLFRWSGGSLTELLRCSARDNLPMPNEEDIFEPLKRKLTANHHYPLCTDHKYILSDSFRNWYI